MCRTSQNNQSNARQQARNQQLHSVPLFAASPGDYGQTNANEDRET
jgi:hypothetical protein